MKKYYTRVCNFYYGKLSTKLVDNKKNLPLNGNKEISFDQVEIISRNSKKIISLREINKLPISIKKKLIMILKSLLKRKKTFQI